MCRRKRIIPFLLLVLALAVPACGPGKDKGSKGAGEQGSRGEINSPQHPSTSVQAKGVVTLSEEAYRTLHVQTVAAEKRPFIQKIQATAVIKPNEDRLAHVSPRIPGKVVEVHALLGDRVTKGDLLAVLDSVELGKAKADYLKFKALTDVQQKNYLREKRLFSQKISSEKEVLEAEAAYLSAKAEFDAAHATLHLYGLGAEEIHKIAWSAEEPISHFPLLSPFAGTVVEKHAVVGEAVSPKTKLYTIADLSTLWIQLDIYEKDLTRVSTGMEVALRVESYPQDTFHGQVAYVGDLLNEATRTMPSRVEIDNRTGKLKAGMFATATIASWEGGEEKTVLAIPATAVQRIEGKPVVFVQAGELSFARRWVTLGESFDQWVEVVSGVEEGEQVVSEESFTLKSELLKDTLAGEE